MEKEFIRRDKVNEEELDMIVEEEINQDEDAYDLKSKKSKQLKNQKVNQMILAKELLGPKKHLLNAFYEKENDLSSGTN